MELVHGFLQIHLLSKRYSHFFFETYMEQPHFNFETVYHM
jgi:hypothetical protein